MGYDAFISYSHDTDGARAKAIEDGLERFAKPWYRRRSLNVFRDTSGLSANPGLWSSITEVMEDSDRLIVLCSPEAAASPWVGREIEHWVATKPSGTILPVLTAGELVWDQAQGAFDLERSTAAPPALAAGFSEEPLWVDLRFADTPEQRTLRDVRFRDAIADLAAPMHAVAKDELIGEDIRQHRRTLRFAWGAVVTLLVLAIGTIAGAATAYNNAQESERLADEVLAANASLDELNNNIDVLNAEQAAAQQELDETEALLTEANADAEAAGIERDAANAGAANANTARDAALGESLRFQGLADAAELDAITAQVEAADAQNQAGEANEAAAAALLDQQAAEDKQLEAELQASIAEDQKTAAEAAEAVAKDAEARADEQAAASRRIADQQGAIAKATRLANDSSNLDLRGGHLDLSLLLAAEAAAVQPDASALSAAGLSPAAVNDQSIVPEAHGALLSSVIGAAGIDQYLHFSCNIPLVPPCVSAPQKLGKVAVSPDGQYIAAVEDSDAIQLGEQKARLFVWQITGAPARPRVMELAADLDCVTDLQWLGGNVLATVEAPLGCLNPFTIAEDDQGIDYSGSFVQLWDPITGNKDFPCGESIAISPSGRSPVAVSSNGQFAAVTCDFGVDSVGPFAFTTLLDGPSLRGDARIDFVVTRPASVAFSESGRYLQAWDWLRDSNAVWDFTSWIPSDQCGCFASVGIGGSHNFAPLEFGRPADDGSEDVVAATVRDGATGSDIPIGVEVYDITRTDIPSGALLASIETPNGMIGTAFAGDDGDTLLVSELSEGCSQPGGECTESVQVIRWLDGVTDDPIAVPAVSTACATSLDVPTVSGGGDRLLLERFCYAEDRTLIGSSVLVIDIESGQLLRELRGTLSFSSEDDRYVVTEQFDVVTKGAGTLPQFGFELWDFGDASGVGALAATQTDARPSMSPDGLLLAGVPSSIVSDEAGLTVWRLTPEGVLGPRTLPGSIGTRAIAYVDEHSLIGVGRMGAAIVWDPDLLPYRQVFAESDPDTCDEPDADPKDILDTRLRSAVSRDGTVRAVSRDSRSIELVDLPNGPPGLLPDLGLTPEQRINYMFFSADGQSLLVNIEVPNPNPEPNDWRCRNGVPDGAIVVPLDTSKAPTPLDDETVLRSSDEGGRLLTLSSDGSTLNVRELADPLQVISTIATSALPPTNAIVGNLYTLDRTGSRVAGTNPSGRAVVWSVSDREVLFNQPEQVAPTARLDLFGISFSPDGTRLAVKAVDQTLRVYNLERPSQQPVTRALPTDAAARVAYSPNGDLIAVDGIYLFDAATLRPVGDRLRPETWDEPTRDLGTQSMRFHETLEGSLFLIVERFSDVAAVEWQLDAPGLHARACDLAGRNLTEREFNLYAVGTSYRPTCGA